MAQQKHVAHEIWIEAAMQLYQLTSLQCYASDCYHLKSHSILAQLSLDPGWW